MGVRQLLFHRGDLVTKAIFAQPFAGLLTPSILLAKTKIVDFNRRLIKRTFILY